MATIKNRLANIRKLWAELRAMPDSDAKTPGYQRLIKAIRVEVDAVRNLTGESVASPETKRKHSRNTSAVMKEMVKECPGCHRRANHRKITVPFAGVIRKCHWCNTEWGSERKD